MRTDHAITTLDRQIADADTTVFHGGLLYAVPDLRDTQRIAPSLPPVPAPSTRRPAVTGEGPAGRRVTMIADRLKRAAHGTTGDRLFYLLAAAVAGAVIVGLVMLEHRYPTELTGGVR